MALPTLLLSAGFASGSASLQAFGRDAQWSIHRGGTSTSLVGFVAPAGTLNVRLNNRDRRFDPNHTTGPYGTDVVPGVPIAFAATWAATTYQLFHGYADDWPQTYPMVGQDQTVELQATDATGRLANAQIQLAHSRPTELTGSRVDAILSDAGYTGLAAVSPGYATVAPLKRGAISAWSHLTDVANVEWGDLYVAKNGGLTFRDRALIANETRSNVVQATFSDTGTDLKYTDITMASLPIVNDCTISYDDKGRSVHSEDTTSQAQPWGKKSLPLSLPLGNPTAARKYADWIIFRYGYPLNTFASITFKPATDPTNLWPQALGRELGDLISVTRTPMGGGSAITRNCWIRGISHDYQSHDWKTTFYLDDASWIVGLFRWDVSLWDGPDVWGP